MVRPSKSELLEYSADYGKDTDFSSHARLLQSKWRHSKQYPKGKYGNFLEKDFAMAAKTNFLTENIRNLVTKEVADSKKNGSLISEPRIWDNLLSSQPLCFNLFGELYYDQDLATEFFKKLFPSRIDKVTSVKFEYSAGRGNNIYTGDHSAFDMFIEYTKDKQSGFAGIEVKYTEDLREESTDTAERNFNKHEREYLRLTTESIFKPDSISKLKLAPLSQIWRDHLLALSHLTDYDTGFFIFLFPKENTQCQKGVDEYRSNLKFENEEASGFYPRHLDDFISTLRSIHDTEWTRELEERYLGKY